jgi:hypothetical protein
VVASPNAGITRQNAADALMPISHNRLTKPPNLFSRVPLCIHEAKRNIRIFSVSCRSAMNFAMESFSEEVGRESRSVSRLARVLMEAAGVAIEECGDDGR